MRVREGTVYHIKDEFFDLIKDCGIKSKSPYGHTYPAYCCSNDKANSLFWMIPMSTNLAKYQAVFDREMDKYGHCYSIVIGTYDNKKVAFQIQGMFPAAKRHILHEHTRMGKKVPVSQPLSEEIKHSFDQMRELEKRGIKCILTDVNRIEQRLSLMLRSSAGALAFIEK